MNPVSYAGFWKRLAAFVIDTVLTSIVGGALGFLLSVLLIFLMGVSEEATIELYANSIGIVLGWLYFAWMESSHYQGTLGKMVLNIKVTDMQGSPLTFAEASGRYFGKILSTLLLGIGFLMVAFTEKKQGLHDMLAGCLVVDK